jgi:hypothetical protein
MKEAMDWTRQTAVAAKVYGVEAAEAGTLVSKAMLQGTVEGDSPFAIALRTMSKISPKMPMEERAEKILKVLQEMGQPIDDVTQNTETMMQRLSAWAERFFGGAFGEAYERIGTFIKEMMGGFASSESSVQGVSKFLSEASVFAMDIGEALIGVGKYVWVVIEGVDFLRVGFKAVAYTAKVIYGLLDLGVHSIKTMGVLFDAMTSDDSKGMAKFYAMVEGLSLKFDEMGLAAKKVFLDIYEGITLLGRTGFFEGTNLDKLLSAGLVKLQKDVAETEKSLADRQSNLYKTEKMLGMSHQTSQTRDLAAEERKLGLDRKGRDALFASITGKPLFQMNVNKLEIKQDFKDADPDRVMIEFVKELENLASAGLQSSVGGGANAFAHSGRR